MNNKEEYLEQAKKLAQSKGGECLSTQYISAKTKLTWKCSNLQHLAWEANLDNVKNSNTWCPECSGRYSKETGLSRAKNLAESKGGECLSTVYQNKNNKFRWKCNNNHIWTASYHNVINHGRWCPKCATYYYKEHIIRDLLEYLLGFDLPKSKPEWNINPQTKNLLELDGYNEEIKIAFEFQGLHHYKIGVFHSKKNDLEYIKYKDAIKKQNCLENNVQLIIIEDMFKLSQKKEILYYILTLLKDTKFKIINQFDDKIINKIFSNLHNVQKKNLENAKNIAISKNGQCLSTEYINAHDNLLWKCSNKEHLPWKARLGHVTNGSWCPHCNGVLPNELRMLQAKKYALSRGGECISSDYINIESKLIWKCSNTNHIPWESSYIHTVDRGRWCPRCAGRFSKEEFLEFAKIHAKNKQGQCLSTKYIKYKELLNWKCSNSTHQIWEDSYLNVVIKNKWCIECKFK